MGYDAFVRCNCYKEGKINKPYFSEYLVETVDGFELNLPKDILNDKNLSEKIENDFYEWEYKGCEHENMQYFNCRIANAGGMGWLIGAIKYINKSEKIPLFMDYIEHGNGGYLSYENIHEFKNEVDIFKKHGGAPIHEFRYINENNNAALYDTISFDMQDDKNILFSKNNIEIYVINGNFYITENSNIVFQVDNFVIYKQKHDFSYVNTMTKEKYTCKYIFENKYFSIYTKNRFTFKKNTDYFVERFECFADDFYDLIKASLETKNPIIWC
jgi:hypothetical protein